MTVTTLTPTTGNIHLAPGTSDAGIYPAAVRASDGALSDSKSLTITVNNINHAPTASAGGPYTGIINIAVNFNGSGPSDPDGDPLTYAWDFGDASTGVGVTPSHTYTVVGLYNVTLHVEDSFGLSDDDATTANIIDVLPATAFAVGGNTKTSLGAGKPSTCFQIQPDSDGFNISDVDLSSIVMISPGTGSVSQISASGKTSTDGDKNGDGITEITACFSKDDMRLLWSNLPSGTTLVTVTFEGHMFSGGTFRATLADYPVKSNGGGVLAATISPNPLNPQAVLTFSTSKAGFVKVMMFDVQGRLVRTLADNPSAPAGYHDITIDGMNSSGVRLASGRYFVIVNTADGREKMSVTILK
jgi:PKD repeat protein